MDYERSLAHLGGEKSRFNAINIGLLSLQAVISGMFVLTYSFAGKTNLVQIQWTFSPRCFRTRAALGQMPHSRGMSEHSLGRKRLQGLSFEQCHWHLFGKYLRRAGEMSDLRVWRL